MLDDGRLTDGQGRTVDFTNTIIVMTSNLGSRAILEETEDVEARVMEVVRGHFRPEFLNRIDDIIIFNHLRKTDIEAIVNIQFERLLARLSDRDLSIQLSDEARALLAEEGYDPVYGARPLKRAIQRMVLDPLAEKIIAGELARGAVVSVGCGPEGLEFKVT